MNWLFAMVHADIFSKTEVIVQFHSEVHDKLCNSSIICFSPSKPPELTLKSLYYFSLHCVFTCSCDSAIQWRLFLRHLQCLLVRLSDGSTLCSVWGPNCTQTHTHTHTHHTSTYVCVYCKRVSVFKRLRDERRNCSKSRSLSCKIIRHGILIIRCFCSELYIVRTTEPAFPSVRHITERGRESEWRREKRFWIIHQTKP